MSRGALLFLALFWSSSAALAADTGIPVVGLDGHGESKEAELSRDRYVTLLGHAARSAQESTLRALSSTRTHSSAWRLAMVIVGLRIELDAGLGELGSAGASSQFDLTFSNKTEPAVP